MNEKIDNLAELMRGARPNRRPFTAELVHRDPTLVEMLSLSDWWKFVAETIGLLLLLVVVDLQMLKGNAPTSTMPHPYWIPVLLMSGQYGILGGLFATVAATAAYFMIDVPSQSAAMDFYAYAGTIVGQPAAWLASALILGGLRSLHIRHSCDLKEQLVDLEIVADELSDGLENALREVRNLERRIAVDASTVAAVSRSMARLNSTTSQAAAASFRHLVQHSVGATSFTIYLKEQSGFKAAYALDGGRTLPIAAVPPLETSLVEALSKTEAILDGVQLSPETGERVPVIAALVRRPDNGEALGAVVCQSASLSQNATVAGRRLDDLARALAAVLSACAEARCRSAPR